MRTKTLSARQRDVLNYVRDCVRKIGYPPTVREIGKKLGMRSPNGVRCHLQALHRKGAIILAEGTARGITIVASGQDALSAEREECAKIALALDSGRGNEKEIAKAIRARAQA